MPSTVSPAPAAPPESYYLVCIAGPDRGKRARIETAAIRIGSTPDCNLLTDDPDVTGPFALVQLRGGHVSIVAPGRMRYRSYRRPDHSLAREHAPLS